MTEHESDILKGRVLSEMNFHEKVWALCARIPKGRVATYADLAHALGGRGYRAVGQAMNRNPLSPRVPCHRVVGSSGKLTGFASGLAKKHRMLRDEGVTIRNDRVDLKSHRVEPDLLRL